MNEYATGYLSGYLTKIAEGDKKAWHQQALDYAKNTYKENPGLYNQLGVGLGGAALGAGVGGSVDGWRGAGIGALAGGAAGPLAYNAKDIYSVLSEFAKRKLQENK